MGKHNPPSTGTGRTGGHGSKPAKGQVSITTATGAIIWKATASLFGKKKS